MFAALTLLPTLPGCMIPVDSADIAVDGNVLRGGDVETHDINAVDESLTDNERLEPGEVAVPVPNFYPKETCSSDVKLHWRACFVELDETITTDLTGTQVCGSFQTTLHCVDGHFEHGASKCVNGHCDYNVSAYLISPLCGWKITHLIATNEESEVIEWFDLEFIESLGFELLKVG